MIILKIKRKGWKDVTNHYFLFVFIIAPTARVLSGHRRYKRSRPACNHSNTGIFSYKNYAQQASRNPIDDQNAGISTVCTINTQTLYDNHLTTVQYI